MLKYRAIYYIFSGTLVAASVFGLAVLGLRPGIDFTGGSFLEIATTTQSQSPPSKWGDIEKTLESDKKLNLGDVRIQPTSQGFLIKLKELDEKGHQEVLTKLKGINQKTKIQEVRFESIGPAISGEMRKKAFWQITLVIAGIAIYIAWAFRKVGKVKPKSRIAWKFSITAIIALIHDVTITAGVFAFLGKLLNVEVDNSFIAALLLVLGYSVNDTIVVFDRLRENLIKNRFADLEQTINKSVRETFVRSINTTSTVLLILFALLLFGGSATFYFVLALIIGISIGTYSSIFVASTLLYEWERKSE